MFTNARTCTLHYVYVYCVYCRHSHTKNKEQNINRLQMERLANTSTVQLGNQRVPRVSIYMYMYIFPSERLNATNNTPTNHNNPNCLQAYMYMYMYHEILHIQRSTAHIQCTCIYTSLYRIKTLSKTKQDSSYSSYAMIISQKESNFKILFY